MAAFFGVASVDASVVLLALDLSLAQVDRNAMNTNGPALELPQMRDHTETITAGLGLHEGLAAEHLHLHQVDEVCPP